MQEFNNELFKIYMKDMARHPLLSEKEEQELARRIQNNDQAAKEKLINSNLRFVVQLAGQYATKKSCSLSFEDLICEGNIGLCIAAGKFKPDETCRFITYAQFWIRRYMIEAMKKARNIRIPTYLVNSLQDVEQAQTAFFREFGRPATLDELSELTKMDKNKLSSLLEQTQKTESLDKLIGEDSTLMDVLSVQQVSPEEEMLKHQLKQELETEVNNLPEKMKNVVIDRFGLNDGEIRTLEDIGSKIGVTRERVRQIEKSALSTLCKKRSDLRVYLAS